MQRLRQAQVEDDPDDMDTGVDLKDIPTDRDYTLPSTAPGIAPEKASAILSQLERKRKAAAIAVPTDDGRVRRRLREMGEPMTLFGEDAYDRRDRLRQLMAQQLEEGGEDVAMEDAQAQEEADQAEPEEEFYTSGSPALLAARRAIAHYSIPRAKARVQAQLSDSTIPLRIHSKHRKAIKESLSQVELYGSQIAGERPISIVRFAPDGKTVAAGNWGGGIKMFSVPNLEQGRTLRGHTARVGGIAWFPKATLPEEDVSPSAASLASGGEEGNVLLWSLTQDTPLATLAGHSGRVCRVEIHPSGRYIASASYDTTWRLWDAERATSVVAGDGDDNAQLLLQEGHSREVYSVSFSPDGALLASGGLDSIGRIWDLRTGRTLMILDSHVREVYALDWAPDGYRLLSGSGDGWLRCWDLRMVRAVSGGIGAHRSVVSDLRWYKGEGNTMNLPNGENSSTTPEPKKAGTFVVTSGYDKNVNIFSADDWSLAKTLSGHAGNVTSVDISRDSRWIASSGQERTVKIWGADDGKGI